MARLPRILPLIAIAIGGVVAVRAQEGVLLWCQLHRVGTQPLRAPPVRTLSPAASSGFQ